uniref:Uncharacterized protein n=1 Tax=Ditylum brightwellii TaxID=49249 RepID=A0A7S4R120_9STRA
MRGPPPPPMSDADFVPTFFSIGFLYNASFFALYFDSVFACAWLCEALLSRIPKENIPLRTLVWALMFTLLPLAVVPAELFRYIVESYTNKKGQTFGDLLVSNLGRAIIQEYIIYYFFAVISALLVFIWFYTHHRCRLRRNTNEAAASKTADALTMSVAVFFVELFFVIADWIGFYNIGTTRARIQLIDVSRVASLLALFYFFVLVLRKYQKIREKEEEERVEIYNQPLTPDNIYQDLSLDPFKFYQSVLVFASQFILFTIYDSAFFDLLSNLSMDAESGFAISLRNGWRGWVYFISATMIMMQFVINTGFSKSFRDSTNFWGSAIAFHRDPKNHTSYKRRISIMILFFFDTTVNAQMLVFLVTIIPFVATFGNEPIDFVLNLVAALYILELDDFPAPRQEPPPVHLHVNHNRDITFDSDDQTNENDDGEFFNEDVR